MDLKDLKDAKEFQEHFVKPLVDAVRSEVKPLVENDRKQEARLAKLEGNQKKAMVGFGVYATVLSLALGATWNWIKEKMGW